jgi:hypothetical protein
LLAAFYIKDVIRSMKVTTYAQKFKVLLMSILMWQKSEIERQNEEYESKKYVYKLKTVSNVLLFRNSKKITGASTYFTKC